MNPSSSSPILLALISLAIFSLSTMGCSDPDETSQPEDAGHSGDVADADAGQDTDADAGGDTGGDTGRDTDADAGGDTDADAEPNDTDPPAEEPELFMTPTSLAFHTPPGVTDWDVVTIRNIGSAPLEIDDISVSDGGDVFSITFFDEMDQNGEPPSPTDDVDEPPSVLDPDERFHMRVHFAPASSTSATSLIDVESDDPFAGTATVELTGNTEPPCLDVVSGDELDFGPATTGEATTRIVGLRNCSPLVDLTIFDTTIDDDPDGVFTISDADLPGTLPDLPTDISSHDIELLYISFTPDGEDAHTGSLTIDSSDAVSPSYDISLSGNGFDAECPVAEVAGSVGTAPPQNPVTASPMDVIQLTSDGSQASDGLDLDYQWTVYDRPSGSMSQIDDPTAADPTFTVDLAGSYLIELRVTDQNELINCQPALLEIDAG